MTHKVQSWDSVPLETMSDLIPGKVVNGETFREFREKTQEQISLPRSLFQALTNVIRHASYRVRSDELQVGNINFIPRVAWVIAATFVRPEGRRTQ
jgi:hypothetical protein